MFGACTILNCPPKPSISSTLSRSPHTMASPFTFDETSLVETLQLVKRRTGDFVGKADGRQVLHDTNIMLKNGLMIEVIKTLRADVDHLCKKDATATPPQSDILHIMRLKAEIIFFTAYQTQLIQSEVDALLSLIRYLSDYLVTQSAQQSQPSSMGMVAFPGANANAPQSEMDWCPPIYSLLVILQLAHVGALQQTTYLLPRDVDYSLPQYQQCKSIEDIIEPGNNLPQTPGDRCGMDCNPNTPRNRQRNQNTASKQEDWLCDGAKGFACLALAVLRQPEVDIDHAPAADVEWFLHEACRRRTYSHIRLCMLPVLQAAYLQDKETTLFYVAVLCELLENLAKIYCMTHYKQTQAHNENDFPYVFFPPTDEFYSNNMPFYEARTGSEAPAAVDSLEDVMSLYSAMLELRPEFAHTFWPSTQSQDIVVQQARQQQSMQTTDHHDIVDHYYHPFVMKAVDASFHHPSLMISAIRFVAALSNSPLGRTAYAGYLFVLDSSHHRFSWDHFFESMDVIALQLGASLTASTATTGVGGFRMGGAAPFSTARVPEQQLQVAHVSLSDKDAEGLVAIMKLIAAVAVHPDVAALLHEAFRPIPRLFALLSCALPISLKGSILKALSVFARGSPSLSEEIWSLVEAHRLLPITNTPFSVSAGAGPQRRQGAHGRGVRVELEESESRAGRYPITEGFLQLLDALLSHGTPDNALGLGYRRPGLMVYLDYVVEDVLLKSHDRPYKPDWPSAYAQRWRITALALRVLCTIMQNYQINAVSGETLAAAEAQLRDGAAGPLLKEVLADFREDSAEYNIEGFSTPQRFSRPKTSAFMVMSLLLGKSRLFDYLGFLLSECSPEALENAFNEHCLSEVGAAVDLLQTLYEQGHPQTVAKQATFDFAFPMATKAAQRPAPATEPVEPLDLTSLGRETHLCDPVFWQERTVAGVIGLLYECALREGKFMALYRSTTAKLTVTRTSDQGRISVQPVIVHDLSELLAADTDSGLLSLIAQVVPTHARSCPCLPAVNVLSVRLLEYLALHLPASRLLAALVPKRSAAGTEDSTSFLIEGCAAALKTEVDMSVEQNDGSLHYDVVCLGGTAYPTFFSLSAAYTRNTSPPNLYLAMISADSTEEAAQVDAEYLRALRLGGTIREAVLYLLLRTLTPNAACLSHQLLGLAPAISSAFAGGAGMKETALSRVLFESCLGAVLYLLSPESLPLGTSFIQQSPEQAADCFELIYRLCSSPLTSSAVLRYLSGHHVDFFRTQLTILVYLMHLSDDELLEGADRSLVPASNGTTLNPDFTLLQSIKTALSNSAAWLIKTCTLSLRHSELYRSSNATTHARNLLQMLYSPCRELSFGAERGDAISVLEKLLEWSTTLPVNPSSTRRISGELQKVLEAASFERSVAKAGSGWGDFNQFSRHDATHKQVLTYKVVDLRLLSSLMKADAPQTGQGLFAARAATFSADELQEGLDLAVLLNIYNKHATVRSHMTVCWCQCVNLMLATGRTQELLQQVSTDLSTPGGASSSAIVTLSSAPRTAGARALAQLVFSTLIVPTVGVISRGSQLQPTVTEHLARSLLSQVKVATASAVPSLLPHQHAQLLQSLIQFLLHREGLLTSVGAQVGAGQSTVSVPMPSFRGLIASALLQVLQTQRPAVATDSGPEDDGNVFLSSQEDKHEVEGDAMEGERVQELLTEIQSINIEMLEQRASELADSLGRDCTHPGPVLWRLSSLAALTAVLATLNSSGSTSGDSRAAYGSHAFVQVLQVLVQRGHLNTILNAVGSAGSYAAAGSAATGEEHNEALFMSALSLSVQVAASVEGVEALLQCHILARLHSLNCFVTPPPLQDEIAYFNDALQSREEATAQLQSRYLMVASLLRCLFAAAPTSHTVATGCAEFLRKNQVLVTQLLRMRYLTLDGLRMTEATVCVLSMLAAVPFSPLNTSGTLSVPGGAQGDLHSLLGSGADAVVADVSTLLGVLGQNPVPASITGGTEDSRSWWEHIQPASSTNSSPSASSFPNSNNSTTSQDLEVQWGRTCAGVPGLPPDWSVYDDKKLAAALHAVTHASAFLRLISAPTATASTAGVQRAVNVGAVCAAFCKCASLSLQLVNTTAAAAPDQQMLDKATSLINASLQALPQSEGLDWLRSPLPVQPSALPRTPGPGAGAGADVAAGGSYVITADADEGDGKAAIAAQLLLISENLICAVHNLVLQGQQLGNNRGQASDVQKVLGVANQFAPHSFIRQVARWIKDLNL